MVARSGDERWVMANEGWEEDEGMNFVFLKQVKLTFL